MLKQPRSVTPILFNHFWSLTKYVSPNKKRQAHYGFAQVLKVYFSNLKSENDKTTKKYTPIFGNSLWILTKDNLKSSSHQTRSAKPILVSYEFLTVYFNSLKSEYAKTTKKRLNHSWSITFWSLTKGNIHCINHISPNKKQQISVLVSY